MLHKARSRDTNVNLPSTPLPSRTSERSTRLPHSSNLPSRTSTLKFFASAALKPDPPIDAQQAWKAGFLHDLRSNKPVRPNGSRPQPNRGATRIPTSELEPPLRSSSAMSGQIRQSTLTSACVPDRCTSAMSQRLGQSNVSTVDLSINSKSNLLAQIPLGEASQDLSPATKSNIITPSIAYRESGQRWMEKQEARSLRQALEDMDLRAKEKSDIAAQEEASELVWKHRNPNMPYKNPDTRYNYKSHLQKGSYARSQSTSQSIDSMSTSDTSVLSKQLIADHLTSERSGRSQDSSGSIEQKLANTIPNWENEKKVHALWDPPQKRAYINLASQVHPVKNSGSRQSSGSKPRTVSAGLFSNPNDQIYEDPEEVTNEVETRKCDQPPATLQEKAWNPISRLPTPSRPFLRPGTIPDESNRKLSRFDIHKNPPSQSRNPSYVQNNLPPTPPDSVNTSDSEVRSSNPGGKDGVEIRSEDIRAATSMRMRDRSPKLPSPTVVSDRPGRPIVSFDRNWKPREIKLKHEHSMELSKPPLPVSAKSAPLIATVNLPEQPSIQINYEMIVSSTETPLPSISVPPSIPRICVEEPPSTARPLPTPNTKSRSRPLNRPLPSHSSTTPVSSSTPHWSPLHDIHRATAQCAACALPIAGRIVSASSQRFHPHCFTCHHCAALLEHVAFYPEPSNSHNSRLARIDARANGVDVPDEEGKTWEDDGDAGLRFFCHLDFHEQFSPRCRSCKTPIEGEVILACGGEWHAGHFFCAECGDPFDAKTPFVERDGYAWCVDCHTRRFSGKCKGCRKPIVDLVVRALGGEWHEGCFCCKVCRPIEHMFSAFDDSQKRRNAEGVS